MKTTVEKQFFKFVIPSMLTMVLTGFYVIVDGLFIGQAVGDRGLAAINLAWPITAIINALGVGLGAGGAVVMSLLRGEGDEERARRARAHTYLLLAAASVFCTVFFGLLYPRILRLLGAQGAVYDTAANYIRVVVFGCTLQVFGNGLTPMLRNDHKTVQTMVIMICGLVTNIVLDAWFVLGLHLEVAGAAWATLAAQGVTMAMCLWFLLRDPEKRPKAGDYRPQSSMISWIARIGASPFGLSLMPSAIIVVNNWQCIRYGGDTAVAAYSIISYVSATVQLLLQGVGEGIQPLISFCMGARQYEHMRSLRRRSILFVLATACILIGLTAAAQNAIPRLFGASPQAARMAARGILMVALALPAVGLVKMFCSYFYATGETRFSCALIYLDPVVVTPLLLLALPAVWGIDGIWAAYPFAYLVMLCVLAAMYGMHIRKMKRLEEAMDHE